MERRKFIQQSALASAGLFISKGGSAGTTEFPTVRVAQGQRKFRSEAVEKAILDVKNSIGNKELGWLFENCFPNTLDTTVDFEMVNGKPDTYVITGDIDAMWLRDSSAQVWPYLQFVKQDAPLKRDRRLPLRAKDDDRMCRPSLPREFIELRQAGRD